MDGQTIMDDCRQFRLIRRQAVSYMFYRANSVDVVDELDRKLAQRMRSTSWKTTNASIAFRLGPPD